MLPVEQPFKTYTDRKGNPLDNGFIYFGQPNLDPISNPITVYWDAAGTIPVSQPLRTMGGYIVRNGTPANVFFGSEYSELVNDKHGSRIFYAPSSNDFSVGTLVQSFTNELQVTLVQIADYAALRSYTGNHTNVYVIDVAKVFVRNDTDTTSADNGGTIIVASNGKRWYMADTDIVTPEHFGAKADGITDDTASIFSYLVWLNGRETRFVKGKIYRITQPLSNCGASIIRISGESPAYITHAIINAAQLNNDPLYRVTGAGTPGFSTQVTDAHENAYMLATIPGVAIIKCDGCNLIGAPDTGSMNAAADMLKLLENVVVWGVNGAKMGVYVTTPVDMTVRDATFVLFEYFGYAQRGGVTTNLDRVGFVDCGWNMANSGAVGYPNTYTSGCGAKFISNVTANDYTTVNGTYRPTTIKVGSPFFWGRGYTANHKSGLRGIQAHGVMSMAAYSPWSYTGHFFDICQIELHGYHIETYHKDGLNVGDGTPMCGYFLNSQVNAGVGTCAMVGSGVPAGLDPFVYRYTENDFIPSYQATTFEAGYPRVVGPVLSNMPKDFMVGTPGSTVTYTWKNITTIGGGAGSKGFIGLISVQVSAAANLNNYSRGIWAVAIHSSGSDKAMTPVQLSYESTVSGAFGAAIAVSLSGKDLRVSITWGANWAATDSWHFDVAMHGGPVLSV